MSMIGYLLIIMIDNANDGIDCAAVLVLLLMICSPIDLSLISMTSLPRFVFFLCVDNRSK